MHPDPEEKDVIIMKINKSEFIIPNISNIPSDREKLFNLLMIFNEKNFSRHEIFNNNFNESMDLSAETFRKMVNHSAMIGILSYQDRVYDLSKASQMLLKKEISIDKYFNRIINKDKQIKNSAYIILLLLSLFSGNLKIKTLNAIFSYIGKERLDESSRAAVGRNLRAIFSLLRMMGLIDKSGNEIILSNKSNNEFEISDIKSIKSHFRINIINANYIREYLNTFFEQDVTSKVLACVSTYETSNYIWSKSSLYKNQGEIKNLYDEYIMTVILQGDDINGKRRN